MWPPIISLKWWLNLWTEPNSRNSHWNFHQHFNTRSSHHCHLHQWWCTGKPDNIYLLPSFYQWEGTAPLQWWCERMLCLCADMGHHNSHRQIFWTWGSECESLQGWWKWKHNWCTEDLILSPETTPYTWVDEQGWGGHGSDTIARQHDGVC